MFSGVWDDGIKEKSWNLSQGAGRFVKIGADDNDLRGGPRAGIHDGGDFPSITIIVDVRNANNPIG